MMNQPTILVLEDERPLQEAIRLKLTKNNFHVQTAKSVEEGLKFLETSKPDAIWLDHYLLGKESGLDLVAMLKQSNEWKNIPIFVVSNTAGPDKVQSYIRLGVAEYYTKSDTRLDQIVSDIQTFLAKPQ